MNEILVSLGKVILILVISLCGYLLGLLVPTARYKSYKTLAPELMVNFGRQRVSVDELVHRYKPVILQSAALRGPKPTGMRYEVIPGGDERLYMVYRVVWPDEVHPNIVLHWVYRIFRRFYYNSVQDIEVIQLLVNMRTGLVDEVQFETDPTNLPDIPQPVHARVRLVGMDESDNVFYYYLDKEALGKQKIEFKGDRLYLPVLTWNHLFTPSRLGSDYQEYDLPLENLSYREFRQKRYDRRSWMDFGVTLDKRLPILIGLTFCFLIAIVSGLVLFGI